MLQERVLYVVDERGGMKSRAGVEIGRSRSGHCDNVVMNRWHTSMRYEMEWELVYTTCSLIPSGSVQVLWGSEPELDRKSSSIQFRFRVRENVRTGPKVRFSVWKNMP